MGHTKFGASLRGFKCGEEPFVNPKNLLFRFFSREDRCFCTGARVPQGAVSFPVGGGSLETEAFSAVPVALPVAFPLEGGMRSP